MVKQVVLVFLFVGVLFRSLHNDNNEIINTGQKERYTCALVHVKLLVLLLFYLLRSAQHGTTECIVIVLFFCYMVT